MGPATTKQVADSVPDLEVLDPPQYADSRQSGGTLATLMSLRGLTISGPDCIRRLACSAAGTMSTQEVFPNQQRIAVMAVMTQHAKHSRA